MFLSIKITSEPFRKMYVEEVNPDCTVEELRVIASRLANLPSEDIELVHCGKTLKDGTSMKSAGVCPNMTVHVIKKTIAAPKKPCSVSEADLPNIVQAFRNTRRSANYKTTLQLLSQAEVLETIITATPELADDPVAMAIIQDPDLITQLGDAGTAKKLFKAHPALAASCQTIIRIVHEAAAKTDPSVSPSNYFFAPESLSDDDEDMEPVQHPSISSAQLAAALASANSQLAGSVATPATSGTSRAGNQTTITPEMLGRALGHAMATSASLVEQTSSPAASQSQPNFESTTRQLAENLAQMQELGLRDTTINLQALQVTGGNVEEAINLVLSGAMGELSSFQQ